MVKTAKQHLADVVQLEARGRRERKRHSEAELKEIARLEDCGYMRDTLMAAVRDTAMSFEDIAAACGPIPKTLQGYLDKTTRFPQARKMTSVARIIGMRWTLTPDRGN